MLMRRNLSPGVKQRPQFRVPDVNQHQRGCTIDAIQDASVARTCHEMRPFVNAVVHRESDCDACYGGHAGKKVAREA